MEIREKIEQCINCHQIVLFMKGDASFPQCGFSAHAVSILRKYQRDFHAVNILEDQEMRQELKEYSDWPTYPQLYVNGEFIGGVDIMQEMDDASELSELFSSITQVTE